METRLADVRLWADGVGAIADGRASLDWRFHSREQDLLLVKTILIMLADFVEDYATLLAEEQPADDALERIDSTIENLALIGVAIRRTGKASRRRRADTRFDPEDYEELRQHLECVILLRPSKSGLPDQLNPSTLTMVQKRLIEANLKRRHRFVIAQKRFRKVEGASRQRRNASVSQDDTTSKGGGKEADPQSNKASGARRNQGDGQQAPTTKGGLTAASTAEGTLQQHIVEDLLPYTCMVEDCPTPHTAVFSTRKEWEAHAKTDHRAQWRCPLCEEENFVVESKDEIVHHFSTEHQDDLKELTLETLLPWSEAQSMGISSCPVCSSYGREDSPEIIDHVLKHVYEFSLRALPWTKPITHDLTTPIGTFRVPSDEGLAERLLEWVDEAEGHTAHEFQLSAVEADNYGTDILGGIEDTGYVPDDEYFDAESAAKSSRPQLADSELFDDFFGPYEIPPPAPDPPRLLDPDDFTDVPFPLPSSSNRGDESDDDIQAVGILA
ncbi:hypothetical protein N0V84_000883 [Fusarium piperis]|uniref:C2H2-type domain-containing protein n=1 Tax=Fusarium piperis TaxID=1435070 RepID=A0A9W8WM63_9HYPO|nr:hypothetical protein N0V84_000883 [Fusarium piperis]